MRTNAEAQTVAELIKRLNGVIEKNAVRVALDVGSRDAHIAILLKEQFPAARVFAFECNPAAVALCRHNIGSQDGVHLVDKAVSDTDGTVDFYSINPQQTVTPHADGNIGASSLFRANPNYPHERYVQDRIQVEAVTLKRWAKENGIEEIDLMWMDLQGGELKALRGMEDLIHRTKIIFTEVEYKEMYVGQPLFPEVNDYLVANNFVLYQKMNTSDWFGDVLYVRRDLCPRASFGARLKRWWRD